MPENRIKMAQDQISAWEYQSKEILRNMELKFSSKKCLDIFLSA